MLRRLHATVTRRWIRSLRRLRRRWFPVTSRRGLLLRRWVMAPLRDGARSRAPGPAGERLQPARAPGPGGPRPRLLFVLHDAPGGVRETTGDLLDGLAPDYDGHLLLGDPHRLTLARLDPSTARVRPVQRWWLERPWSSRRFRSDEHRRIYREVLEGLAIDLVHVRHLLGHSFDAVEVGRALDLPLVLSFHDYYLACPTVHLLDDEGAFCGGRCTPTRGQCRLPLEWLEDLPVLKAGFLDTWRGEVEPLLRSVDAFVTTSDETRDRMRRIYPSLTGADFRVIEHGRSPRGRLRLGAPPRPAEKIRLLALGDLGYHKGSALLRRLVEVDRLRAGRLEVHFLGRVSDEVARLGVDHGPYRRAELPERVAAIRPHFAALLSVWPETYSHTLTEAWSLGLPVLATDLGALGERVRRHRGGWMVPADDPGAAYDTLLAAADDPEAYRRCLDRIAAIRWPSRREMAAAYGALYSDLLSGGVVGSVSR